MAPAPKKQAFPPLSDRTLSSTPSDQEDLARIKRAWDLRSHKWAPEVKNTIIRLLPNVRATDSNRTQPSGHKVWKEGRKPWNLGHWVIMNAIYGPEKLSSMKNELEKKYPEVNMQDPYGKERTKQPPAHSQQAAGYRQPQTSHEGGGGS
ncbi:hypothetical protein FDECE_7142 [Fusarium decemcellulare]|nr:hypothetical protein FDECE_7142 [Fusarium decemcellulare]